MNLFLAANAALQFVILYGDMFFNFLRAYLVVYLLTHLFNLLKPYTGEFDVL